ncbi:MAG: polysaccharide deacetylase family protein [Eubacteriales bacterium]|nr:polysaccharide deacetylase family protein [Eubacteriales bacterium]
MDIEKGDWMAKITRAELKRRRRIEMYKKIIIYGFLVMTIFPILTSCFLLYKINKIEKQVDYVLSRNGKDYLTLRSSREALLGNPNADSGFFADSTRVLLGSSDVDTKRARNTEATQKNKHKIEQSLKVEEANVQATDATTSKEYKGRVYLTFDDGPSIYTGQILDILKENDVKATFFVIGRDEEYYDYYKRIVNEGHTIGMHSYTHVYQDFYKSLDSFGAEITKLDQLIYDVTGVHTRVFRFPGGSSNSVSALPIQEYIAYLNEHNINYYDWNSLNGDAVTSGLSPQTLVDNIMNDVKCNEDSIVLMHDLQTTHTTVESLQLLIDTLRTEGYEILPIDENAPLIQHVSCNSIEE